MPTLSVIGEPGAGKSHFATLLYIHLRTHPEINVQVEFNDASWNIITSANRLGRGMPLRADTAATAGVQHAERLVRRAGAEHWPICQKSAQDSQHTGTGLCR